MFNTPKLDAQSNNYEGIKTWETKESPVDLGYRLEEGWLKLPGKIKEIIPSAVYVDSNQLIHILNRGTNNNPSIITVNNNGEFVSQIVLKGFKSPHYLTKDKDGNWWVSDSKSHQINKINEKGEIVFSFGEFGVSGWDENHFNRPTDIDFLNDGRILISDGYQNQRIAIFYSNLKYLGEWGKKGTAPGEFVLPHALTLGTDGLIYLSDRDGWRVQVFNAKGEVLSVWPHIGKIYEIVEAPGNCFFCLDGVTGRITKVNSTGEILGFFGTSEVLDKAHGFGVTAEGDIIVATTAGRLEKYSKK
ncbi:MAG TPA: hypothetical protein VKA10_02120 [Prolixibacteraceae bacterium]|nr:hypothetical protein [Prolixibacteraceae bacterium]